MIKDINIKSFNGIGDLLFLTPSLRVIKEAYPDSYITVSTNYPTLLDDNPFVDRVIGLWPTRPYHTDEDGLFLNYPDPRHRVIPSQHHILSDWKIICAHYGLITALPKLEPEIHFDLSKRGDKVRVQVIQKNNWHGKKSWGGFLSLIDQYGFEPIEQTRTVQDLVNIIAESAAVVCIEGGISHIAKAVGTPAVVIFGGFAHPRWSGYGDQTNVVIKMDCSFCYNPDPCVADYACMRAITPEKVHALMEREGLA